MVTRRDFLAQMSAAVGGLPFAATALRADPFRISLAEWSLHRSLFTGKIHPLDFPVVAKRDYGIDAVEYVSAFFLPSRDFLTELKRRADGEGVRSVLIMVDNEGNLGDPDASLRKEAVARHVRWVDNAQFLGCHAIRVNARSAGAPEEQMRLVADGFRQLAEAADPKGISVIVENHGGLSSVAEWLTGVLKTANHPRLGTLPDFGNFYPTNYGLPAGSAPAPYDRYKAVELMMPYAKGVSAKTHDFDASGNESEIDYERMMRLVLKAGYTGHVGIEYEGNRLSEDDGIRATKRLLERVREKLT